MVSSAIVASESLRRDAHYHPSIWEDHFLIYNLKSNETEAKVEQQQLEQLKVEVRKVLVEATHKPCDVQTLELIDAIQRLGVSYHFETEIDQALRRIHNTHCEGDGDDEEDLYTVSLCFRLLRQHGYRVSSEVFNKFSDGEANFKESLTRDVRGMLSLHESAQLRVHGEAILEKANSFTMSRLESSVSDLSPPIAAQVKQALKRPIRKGLEKLEARNYMSVYQEQNHHNKALLMFSKLDFNLLQKLHQKELAEITMWWKGLNFAEKLPFGRDRVVECYFWVVGVYFEPRQFLARRILSKVIAMASFLDDIYDVHGTIEELRLLTDAIERWDINAMDHLPEYLRVFYQALLDVYGEIEEEMAREKNAYRVYYAKEAMKILARAYMEEAMWLHENHMPTMGEYMSVALISGGYHMLAVASLLGMGDLVTKDTFEWISNKPKIVNASSVICRLMNDIVSHKIEQERGNDVSAVQCYMKEFDASEQRTVTELQKQVGDAWKDMNEEWLGGSAAPKDVLKRVVNLARVIDLIYKDDDGYVHAVTVLKGPVTSLFIDPVPI
uniref:Caryophyllene synthase n=1 Tax=Santalum album TaxID=35974 RepID=A0A678Y1N9_SANAL|nr:caryophyllene synthase [Santalum album]